MNVKKFVGAFSVFAFVLFSSIFAIGQETTGSIEVTVKDPQGAVVPNASVSIVTSTTSSTAGFSRTVQTGDSGSERILQVPPGAYDITVAPILGFGEKKITNVRVELGKVTPVNIDLVTGGGQTVVDVSAGAGDIIPLDTTDTKIQTTISAETAELLPKGTNFASILKVSPATRPEPRSGQFQIDGASGSENTFIIDGQEVTNAVSGVLNQNSNLPFQIIQEVQIKSSGFEAEFGGATGGVINLVTRGGSNRLRGEFGAQFQPQSLQARGRETLFQNSSGAAEYFPSTPTSFLGFFPTANLSGPVIKDRLWFFGSYTPQIFNNSRTITYLNPDTRVPTAVETFRSSATNQYAFARLDAQPISRLRFTGTYTYNPIEQRGVIPTSVSALSTVPNAPGLGLSGAAYLDQTGGRQNSQSASGQAVWTPTNNLVLSLRGGHYFLNEKLGTYGIESASTPRVTCSASSPVQFNPGFGCVRGVNNGIPIVEAKAFDATQRNTIDADATFIFTAGGRHELKGGYQYNGIANQLLNETTSQIVLRRGQSIASYSGVAALESTPGALGAGLLRVFNESGDVSSKNEGIYIQDKYQPFSRLTFNLGVRTERENVPSFDPTSPDLKFDFQDKIAPRLGVAYDLTGDGKTKVSAFYGWFYDRFKYELPRGSFGGQYFHDFYYEILPGDTLATFTVANITGGMRGVTGGRCPETGTAPVFGRVRCDFDFRVPSNAGLGITFGAVDPDIKAFRQSEFTLTFERDLGRNFVFSSRYTRKQVDVAIEDAGFPTPEGSEAYIIGNPGLGLYKSTAESFGYIGDLKPQRQFDALEFRFDRRFANSYYFNLNYTYSRLFGNYSGLASSDEDGRLSPNVNRFFDLPFAGYTVAGGRDNGKLPTDRPHVVKFNGAYSLDWNERFGFGANNTTSFQLFTTVQSGTPLTSVVDILNIETIPLYGRGDLGRTEMFTESDFGIRHRYSFGRDNRYTLVAETDVLNLFNERNELNRVNLVNIQNFDLTAANIGLLTPAQQALPLAQRRALAIRRFQESGAPAIVGLATNASQFALYNKTSDFQGSRSIRFGFRLLF